MVVVVDNGSDLVILLDATEYSDFFRGSQVNVLCRENASELGY